MRRVVFTLLATAVLTFATALPVASSGLTQVTLTCDDGTYVTAEVDADTLAGLVDSVQSLALYPAGLSCSLAQVPVAHALGGVAAAGGTGGGFIVGGGRFLYPCPNVPVLSFWVNFAVSAHTAGPYAGATRGGTVNFTVPAGQCTGPSHLTSKPTCLRIFAEGAPPPTGAWYAYIRSTVTQTSGAHFAPFEGTEISSGWKDTGNPAKQLSPDRVNVSGDRGDCPNGRSPDPDGSGSVPILNGGVTIHPK